MGLPQDLRELAAEHLPSDRVDQALVGVEPAWTLVPDPDGPVRIGGPAQLAAEETWPRNPQGVPMTFLAAIPLGALPALPAPWAATVRWPHQDETLRVFADLVASPHEPCPALVLAAPAGTTLTDTPAPPLPDPWPADPGNADSEYDQDQLDHHVRVRELPLARARPIADLTADEFAFGVPGDDDPDPDAEAYETFAEEVWWSLSDPGAFPGIAKILGAPRCVRDDPRNDSDLVPGTPVLREALVVLFELHHDFGGIEIVGGGSYSVCIPADALGTTYRPAFCSVRGG